MAAIPFMPLYVAEYLADTPHLSTLEHGAYLMLIMAYWQRGDALPDDDRKLARVARLTIQEWADARENIGEFFDITDGVWKHGRIEAELDRARAKLEHARNAGRASAQRRFNGRSTDVKRASNHIERQVEGEKKEGETPNPFAGEAWDGWVESRKKKPTERAVALAISKLAKLKAEGHEPDDVLNQSTMNGWTGLFAVKGQGNGHSGKSSGWLDHARSRNG